MGFSEPRSAPLRVSGAGGGARRRRSRANGVRRILRARFGELSTSALSFRALSIVVISSVMLIGSVHPRTMLAIGALSAVAMMFALASSRQPRPTIPLPAVVLFFLAGYSALQALPLPGGIVAVLTPRGHDIWLHALDPVGGAVPRWIPLSVDPGASLLEALKWASYGAVFVTASAVAARRGASGVVLIVLVSCMMVAAVTLAHGLLGASRVFGVYEPRFGPSRWNVGPLLNANNLVGYLNLGVLLGSGLMASRRLPLPRWLLAIGVVFLLAVAFVSGSRGGMVALAAGLTVLTVLLAVAYRRGTERFAPKPVLLGAFGATLVGGVVLALLAASDRTWLELYDKNVHKLRLSEWATPLMADFPWTGTGRGAFESVFPAYRMGQDDLIYTHVENFPVQWIAEWGLPIALLALGVLAFALRPKMIGALEHPLAAGCYAAFVALALHNLVDLGFEVPAVLIALSAALGACWGARHRALEPQKRNRAAPTAAGVVFAVSLVLVAVFGLQPVAQERLVLSGCYRQADFANDEQVAALRADIRAAMRRHPADPYFPRLGALVALRRGDQDPLPWINRALERGLRSGRSHLLLARILASRGARNQALLELRLAVEYDPGLMHNAAETALRITREYETLLRAVPAGEHGANMLMALARAAEEPELFELHVWCLREAVQRDGSKLRARTALARALIESLAGRSNAATCADTRRRRCIAEVERQAAVLDGSSGAYEGVALSARLRAALGDAEGASELLANECGKHPPDVRLGCLRLRAELAAAGGLPLFNTAVKQLVDAGCAVGSGCVDTFAWTARVLERKGDWLGALTYYRRAAREDPSAKNWAGVARAARKLGLSYEAATAEARTKAIQHSTQSAR